MFHFCPFPLDDARRHRKGGDPGRTDQGIHLPAGEHPHRLAHEDAADRVEADGHEAEARMIRVWALIKALPTMVAPMQSPRKSVTTLAISFSEAFVSRLTTPDSRIRFPSMIVPEQRQPLRGDKAAQDRDHQGEEELRRLGNRFGHRPS